MINTGKLAGKTLLISGASRGIGLGIALKAAKDGANVALLAKTAEPHPKLPGTIFTAAKEIEEAGGKAFPCVVDIRYEDQVEKAVEDTVKKFGGIDILVNNASAISLTGTMETSMKKYDLMNQINTRGTYLCSQKCIPYLRNSKNPHILNISPPLTMSPRWFGHHVAYTIAKYGMSMCVLGMADELKDDGIAVNALWPRTAIYTAAMQMITGDEPVANQCRKIDIMADSAYVILTKDSRNYTGNFAVDEEVLKEVGVTDLEKYSFVPGASLLDDYFLPDHYYTGSGGSLPQSDPKASSSSSSSGSAPAVQDTFKAVEKLLNADLVKSVNGIYAFTLTGSAPGEWYLDLKNGNGSAGQGSVENSDCQMTCDSDDFVKMFSGKLKPTSAFMQGKLKIKGNMALAMKLEKMMSTMKSAAGDSAAAPSGGSASPVQDTFKSIEKLLDEELVKSINGVYAFKLTGNSAGDWYLDLKNGKGAAGQGTVEKSDCQMSCDSDDFVKMFAGQLKPTAAFMQGKLKIKGNMALAMKLEKMMSTMKSKL